MLKLIAPGKRRNKHWLVRGTIEGEYIERSLKVSLRSDAEEKLRELLREQNRVKKERKNITFETAAAAYIAYRNPSIRERQWIKRVCGEIGPKLVGDVTQNDIFATANSFYGEGKASSKNRAVVRPIATILHYAAASKWCDYLRVKSFKEAEVEMRYVSEDVEAKLLQATTGSKRLLILWLFRQGDRISDVLGVKYEDCDLTKHIVRRYIAKSDKWVTLPLDKELCRQLAGTGYIFPWRTRWGVYRWLQPLCKNLGVQFTPHRARHTLGKRLNDSGAGLKTIMQTLGQSNTKSAIRYQTTDIETIRRAKDKIKLGKIRGKR